MTAKEALERLKNGQSGYDRVPTSELFAIVETALTPTVEQEEALAYVEFLYCKAIENEPYPTEQKILSHSNLKLRAYITQPDKTLKIVKKYLEEVLEMQKSLHEYGWSCDEEIKRLNKIITEAEAKK